MSNTETYKEGKLNGEKKIYYTPDDPEDKRQLVSTVMNFKNDLLEGEYKEYFMNGKLKIKGQYLDQQKKSRWSSCH